MTTRLVLASCWLQVWWIQAQAWCLYPCPRSPQDETVCAVDSKLGAKLFRNKCLVWKTNYCQTNEYQIIDIQQCLDQHSEVIPNYLANYNWLSRFQKKLKPIGEPFQRCFILFNLLNSLAPRPMPLPRLWSPIPFPGASNTPPWPLWSPVLPNYPY